MEKQNVGGRPAVLLALVVALVAVAPPPAAADDAWKIGLQAGGTGLASGILEWERSGNALVLSVGVFDSITELDTALWYRRYLRFAPLDSWGLAPYLGAGVCGLVNLGDLSAYCVLCGAAAGIEWRFLSVLSLCVEADTLLTVLPRFSGPAFMPAVALRVRL